MQQNNSALTVHILRSYLWYLKGSFLLWTPLQPEAPRGTSRQSDEHFFFSSHDFCALDVLTSQLQNRFQFLTDGIFHSHLHTTTLQSPQKTLCSPSPSSSHTHKRRIETVKPSLHRSSRLSAAALPMIRHLILSLVRGQSCPSHVSCQSHPPCPPTPMHYESLTEAWLKIAHLLSLQSFVWHS